MPAIKIENEPEGRPEDIKQTRAFLDELPMPACKDTTASVTPDGTIRINIRCHGMSQSMDGIVEIKDGQVIKIK